MKGISWASRGARENPWSTTTGQRRGGPAEAEQLRQGALGELGGRRVAGLFKKRPARTR